MNDNVFQTGFARYVSESDQINYNWRSIESNTFWVLVCVFSLMPFPTMTHPRYLVETNKTLDTWQLHWTCRATLTFLQLQNRRRRDNQRFFHFIAIFFLHSSAIRLWRQLFCCFFPSKVFQLQLFFPHCTWIVQAVFSCSSPLHHTGIMEAVFFCFLSFTAVQCSALGLRRQCFLFLSSSTVHWDYGGRQIRWCTKLQEHWGALIFQLERLQQSTPL